MSASVPKSMTIRLEPFSADNAELVLAWRNSEAVRSNSLSDDVISLKDHLRFVKNLNEDPKHQCFVVNIGDAPQAVLNIKIDGTAAYWGCYVADGTKLIPGLFPLLVAIAGKIVFESSNCDTLHSDVLSNNKSPIGLNKFAGILQCGSRHETRANGENIEVKEFRVGKEQWDQICNRISKALTTGQRKALAFFEVT